jgi:hypothetical protein
MNTPLPQTPPWLEAETHFVSRAMQYYVASRFATLSQQFPVCGNLLHHAVELALKGALCRTHTRDEISSLRHNLRKAWLAFKTHFQDPRLLEFDAAVNRLNKFERIRYPDDVLNSGMRGTFCLERAHVAKMQSLEPRTPPSYSLILEEIDHLLLLVFEITPMNPHFYLNSAPASARSVLNDRNPHQFPPAA